MTSNDAAWSGWGAPSARPEVAETPFGVKVVFGGDAQSASTRPMSKNRMRRQRRGLIGDDALAERETPPSPLLPQSTLCAPRSAQAADNAGDNILRRGDVDTAQLGETDSSVYIAHASYPLTLPSGKQPTPDFGAVAQTPAAVARGDNRKNDVYDYDNANSDVADGDDSSSFSDEHDGDCEKNDTVSEAVPMPYPPDERRHRNGDTLEVHATAEKENNTKESHIGDEASTDSEGDGTGSSDDEPDRDCSNAPSARRGAATKDARRCRNAVAERRRARSDRSVAVVVAPKTRQQRHPSDTFRGAVTRVAVKQSTHEMNSSSSSIVVEGDVLSCRTCGAPSTARRSARMGVYIGDGWVVHAVQRRQRDTLPQTSSVRYQVVQQTLRDFADTKTLSADEWFRTRSEFPAAVRVRRALERVGDEWEVPDGLDDARASEDFAIWVATGQSALTYADYRDERDPPAGSSSSSHGVSSLARGRRGRRDSDERGAVARPIRLRSDSPPPVLARIHRPATPAPSASSLPVSHASRPAPVTSDYRHVVAGGLVGLYLGGPIGGAVGGAAGLLLDSMASLGRGWRP